MSILNVNTIQPIGSGTTVTVAATELKTSNFITVGTGASVTSPSANVLTLGTNTAERFRITSAGSIGIGTDNPGSTKLKIESGSGTRAISLNAPTNGTYITFETAGTAYADIGAEKGVVGSGSADTPVINARGSRDLAFRTNSNERLRITSGGNVGIGSAIPANVLDVQGTTHTKIHVGTTGTGHATGIQINHAKGNAALQEWQLQTDASADGNLKIRNATSSTDVMFFDADNNNIGINETTPNFHLDVNGNIALREGQVLTWHDGSGNKAGDVYIDSSDNFVIRNTSSVNERLRITSAGLIGINDTSPDATLSVGGSTAFIDIGAAGGNRGKIGYSSNNLYFGTSSSSGEFIFKNNVTSSDNPASSGTTRMRITGSGHVLRPTMAAAVCTTTGATTLSTFNTSYQTIAVNVEGYDNANNFNTTNYRFTAPETGFYQVGCNVQLENASGSNTNNWMYIYPLINGSDPATSTGNNHADFDPTVTFYYSWNYSTLLKLSQNDYVEWKYRGNLTSVSLKGGVESTYYFYQVG